MVSSSKVGQLPWSLIVPAVILVLAVSVQGMQVFHEVPKAREAHLAESIPGYVPGWTSREVPLGANEFLSNEVEKVLNYDEVVNRDFSRGDDHFGVYVAYWSAGKMPTRLVASHTPDRCWTENGWHCLSMKFRQPETFEGGTLQPAEWRLFEPPTGGKPTYVLYWHLVDGHSYDYGDRFNNVPDPVLWWKDAVQQALRGSREQYFIRLTSNRPLEQLWEDPGFSLILKSLEKIGLASAPPVLTSQ